MRFSYLHFNVKSHRDDQKTAASDLFFLWRLAERAGLFSLEKKMFHGDFIAIFQSKKGAY